jgi:hypothetical protein
MPGYVFRCAVHDDVGAHLQRAEKIRCGEGIVDTRECAMPVSQVDETLYIGHFDQRVRHRLEVQYTNPAAAQGSLHHVEIEGVDIACLDSQPGQLRQQAAGSSIEVCSGDDDVARPNSGTEKRPMDGGEPRSECDDVLGSLQESHRLLEVDDGGISIPAVRVANRFRRQRGMHIRNRVVSVGGGQVDGRRRGYRSANPHPDAGLGCKRVEIETGIAHGPLSQRWLLP